MWSVRGTHPRAGAYRGLDALFGYFGSEYRSLDEWRALMRRRSELTGGTYRPQPRAWLGRDEHVFCFLRLTAGRPDGRAIDTSHVAVFRMGDDGLVHEFWDVSSDQAGEDAFWADGG